MRSDSANLRVEELVALTRYLEDGDLSIDNNHTERSLRGIAIGRNYVESAIMCSA